jgi:acyl carrier protein
MASNLPQQASNDSAGEVKQFFNKYLTDRIEYPASEVDAVIGYFENRGFEKSSAIAVATALLQQAKIDSINVFELIDTLKGLTNVQLSDIVANVLNYDREKISTLGFKVESKYEKLEKRNILY